MATFKPYTLNLGGDLIEVASPLVMGIVNATPDSFYSASRGFSEAALRQIVEQQIADGVDILDIGACSTRPGSDSVSQDEEIDRLRAALSVIRRIDQSLTLSVDTFRAEVARFCVEEFGVGIINDISGGLADDRMFATVAELRVPYVMMHTRGTPATMQSLTDYPRGVAYGVIKELSGRLAQLNELGVADVIIDPGFCFAKTLEQNYELVADMPAIADVFGKPLLVGISRKSMLTRLLGIDAAEALEATTALNMALLDRGASILRVHDVKAARQAVAVFENIVRFNNN